MKEKLLEYLSRYITENKRQLMDKVLDQRTRYLTIVLEDVFQPQNASAVVRSCDCFGVQDLHIIENRNKYQINRDVTQGSSKWVNIIKYNNSDDGNTIQCLESLKQKGYRVFATSPHQNDVNLDELPLDKKFALVFGTEKEGLSEEALKLADGFVKIPMVGFTDSLNLSVCAAVSIHHILQRIKKSDFDWSLSKEEKEDIKLAWIRKIIKKSDLLEQEFYKRFHIVKE
jgi:tRNA (guanosine-2'-O-)-methyltransferase